MWMNMGYWEANRNVQLPEACKALLEKVLEAAGLDIKSKEGEERILGDSNTKRRRVLLDLGFGCGEQTMHLMMNPARSSSPIFDEYIGITLDKVQHGFAQSRLQQKVMQKKQQESSTEIPNIALFCADGAQPSTWSEELKQTVFNAFSRDDYNDDMERYVMGLDTLYHFHPSRREIFEHTHSTLHANLLAFDLFLAPPNSSGLKRTINTLFLRLLTPALGAPFGNFVSSAAYRNMLEKAGYKTENIIIQDITDHVFTGLATFLEKRCQDMAKMGLGGYTKWQVAGWLFRWLSNGGILRAGIIVAKRD
ncbi:hypothetical protein MGYG_02109 [Nannizzia gypsea CBS 118893]|uniref:Methyltransferase domain-containing protein n=1 Tax=Arthroderma gypseum (strain ATCC MYA-4604 / CBS 118893) TaxID=535722 RepID=E4UPQ8_ARTGP|nr:hypothetical protein MGYG_02109 [Nannizzia gypsea CBS 118893]EFQ99095.1 hypothetical protein MGYG_02109 [Nannizzia gypsea CBS 118893]